MTWQPSDREVAAYIEGAGVAAMSAAGNGASEIRSGRTAPRGGTGRRVWWRSRRPPGGEGFDAVHASPPCQSESDLRHRTGKDYADLLTPTLARLRAQQRPWIVENVESTDKLPGALVLCGTEFGLRSGDRWLKRHRRFLASFPLWGAGGCSCRRARIGGVYGTGGGGPMTRGFKLDRRRSAEAMGIDWMSRAELSQAIPPAFTEYLGAQLLDHLRSQVPP